MVLTGEFTAAIAPIDILSHFLANGQTDLAIAQTF
jgi:hypothetical protein